MWRNCFLTGNGLLDLGNLDLDKEDLAVKVMGKEAIFQGHGNIHDNMHRSILAREDSIRRISEEVIMVLVQCFPNLCIAADLQDN